MDTTSPGMCVVFRSNHLMETHLIRIYFLRTFYRFASPFRWKRDYWNSAVCSLCVLSTLSSVRSEFYPLWVLSALSSIRSEFSPYWVLSAPSCGVYNVYYSYIIFCILYGIGCDFIDNIIDIEIQIWHLKIWAMYCIMYCTFKCLEMEPRSVRRKLPSG